MLKSNDFVDMKSLDGKVIGVSQASIIAKILNQVADELGITLSIIKNIQIIFL